LKDSFPEYVEFANEKGVLVRQPVIYEWQPFQCAHCLMYGHATDLCRKKPQPRQEWRPVQNKNQPSFDGVQPQQQPSSVTNSDPVPTSSRTPAHAQPGQASAPRSPLHAQPVHTLTENRFSPLQAATEVPAPQGPSTSTPYG